MESSCEGMCWVYSRDTWEVDCSKVRDGWRELEIKAEWEQNGGGGSAVIGLSVCKKGNPVKSFVSKGMTGGIYVSKDDFGCCLGHS